MSEQKKIIKANDEPLDDFEKTVEQAFLELQNGSDPTLSATLHPLHLCSAKEIDVSSDKKAAVLFVPVPMLRHFQDIHKSVVRELEKKFSGKHVVIIAQRRILRPEPRKNVYKQPRPKSRTLTAVHDKILEDIVYPTEIYGKRIRYRHDGTVLIKILFHNKDEKQIEHKLDTFSAIYKKLTGKAVVFEFPPS